MPFFHPTASVFISCITCGFLLNAAKPLYLEVICEGVYPVGEGVTIGALNWLSNCIGLTFLFVMMIPDIGKKITITNVTDFFSLFVCLFFWGRGGWVIIVWKNYATRILLIGMRLLIHLVV